MLTDLYKYNIILVSVSNYVYKMYGSAGEEITKFKTRRPNQSIQRT